MTPGALVATGIAAAALAAGPAAGQTNHPSGAAVEHAVAVNDAGYVPGEMVVGPGRRAVFTNVGVNPHTVTSDTGAFDSGTLLKDGRFALVAPAATGVYAYHCTFHPFMRGTVTVSTLTLTGPKRVPVGRAARVRGTAPGVAPGTPVSLERLAGASWRPVASTAVAADGTYALTTPALMTGARLRAVAGPEVSPTIVIPVAPRVVARRRAGAALTLTVTVTPRRAGAANLERINPDTDRWARVKRVRIAAAGRATVRVPKPGRYRVTFVAARGLAQASSAVVTLR